MNKSPQDQHPTASERSAYELLPCGVVWVNNKQEITYVNGLLKELLEYTDAELIGERRFYELLSIGGKIYFETYFAPTLQLEGQINETNFEMVDKAGTRHPVVINVTQSSTPGQGFLYVVFPAKDRKEYEQNLKRARHKAEAADRAKSTFISSMSHEIRTPLHAILEAGNFLLKDKPRPDQLEFIQVLRSAGGNLLSVVNDILDISKLEAGMMVLDERPVHLDQLVKQVIDTYRPSCRGKGVDLRSVFPLGDVPLLLADGGKFIQVLNNLVSNAVKFTSAGEIVLTLDHEKEDSGHHKISVRVRDSGVGIADSRLKQIFEPFVQANNTTHADYGGTGLGLAICKKILQASGADLKAKSKIGVGSEFYFSLSLREATVAQRQQDEQPDIVVQKLSPLNHLRVLNVDDNRSNLLINARYFSEWKLVFDQVDSGAETLLLLDEKAFDLVLLDLRMPEMDGYELARRIRSHPDPEVNDLPLIALSASASEDVTAQMLDAGINGLVVKPFEPVYLHQMIRTYGEQEVKKRALKRGQLQTVKTPTIDFSQVREIFAGDNGELQGFLRIIKTDVAEGREVLRNCTFSSAEKPYGDLKHNMISTMRVFMLDDLTAYFEEGKVALEENNSASFEVIIDKLIAGFDAFEAALDVELDR